MDLNKSFSDSRVVLMCGISGSGKTVFARALQELGFTRLSADGLIWEKYGDGFVSLPFSERRLIFQKLDDMLADELCHLLDSGNRVVVDSTMCKRSKRDNMRRTCARYGLEPQIVYLNAPLEVLHRRLSKRTGNGPDDQIVSIEQLQGFYANFEPPQPDETCLKIIQHNDEIK